MQFVKRSNSRLALRYPGKGTLPTLGCGASVLDNTAKKYAEPPCPVPWLQACSLPSVGSQEAW